MTAAALAVLGGTLPFAPARAVVPALFGTAEFRTASLAPLPQWRGALERMAAEDGAVEACARAAGACPSRKVGAWLALLRSLEDQPRSQQVRAVNSFVNGWPYQPDSENWGRSDYWATPLEFFRRSGDCEDYAIAKYRSLRRLGWPADRLRLVVVQDVTRGLPHAVLAAYLGDAVLILDNLSDVVLSQERIAHYVPYYSINETARWAHTARDALVVTAGPGSSGRADP
jgi:predicted transglutaminase-like cysteine proteinase